ncbi:MAG: sugar ABC transporter substrate-binding protein [Phycisphaerae bacterium]
MLRFISQLPRRGLIPMLLCCLAIIGSCSARNVQKGKVMLTYTRWGDPAEMESTRELIAEFERQNPDIEVRVDVVSWGQYWQKMKTATVTGSAQDVWFMSPAFVEEYASAGHLLDLMPFIKGDSSFNADDYFPGAFDDFSYAGEGDSLHPVPFGQGKLFAFTRDYNCSFLYYNRDHFDALGLPYPTNEWTWDDLVQTARKLTIDFNGDGVIDQWGYGGLNYTAFASAIGAQPLDVKRHKSTYSSEQMLKSIAFCQDMIYKYEVHPPPMIRIDETESFVTGKVSMTVAGIWNVRAYCRSEYRWDIAIVPTDAKERKYCAPGGGMGHCVYARTAHPNEAWRLVKFLSSEAGQRELARSGTSVPVLKKAAMSAGFLAGFDRPPRTSFPTIFQALSGRSSRASYARGYMEYTRRTSEIIDQVWRNQLAPADACRQIDAAVDAVLAEQYGGAAQ